jgi:NAD(P)H-dependent flavin oxidoreductase YrpB (nitropropane dioxygenase family)
MSTELQRQFGMHLPLWGFSYEPAVVAAISREGGFGVLGCIRFGADADEMREAIRYVEKESGGRPFGVNVVMPVSSRTVDADLDDLEAKLEALIPQEHRDFIDRFLTEHGVPPLPDDGEEVRGVLGWTPQTGAVQLEVALEFDIALLASALGPPPEESIREAHARNIPVSALVGRVDQARKQRDHGVDIIIAQGTEAGGHTGEIGGMVLTPEVVDALAPAPVLHAGGVGNGRQLAAALALGAQGAWTGSLWLTAAEMQHPADLQRLIIEAEAADTVRSRSLTGKPARQVRTPWIEAWEDPANPDPLPMPLQYLLTAEANARFRAAGRYDLVGTPGGQILGSLDAIRPVAAIMASLREEFQAAVGRLGQVAAD